VPLLLCWQVLVSALNIPDVPAILEHHGLVCVPIDLDLDTLAVDLAQVLSKPSTLHRPTFSPRSSVLHLELHQEDKLERARSWL
jgi:hypothetical protein